MCLDISFLFVFQHLSEGDQGINIKVFPLGQTALAQESPMGGGKEGQSRRYRQQNQYWIFLQQLKSISAMF